MRRDETRREYAERKEREEILNDNILERESRKEEEREKETEKRGRKRGREALLSGYHNYNLELKHQQ